MIRNERIESDCSPVGLKANEIAMVGTSKGNATTCHSGSCGCFDFICRNLRQQKTDADCRCKINKRK